MKTLDEIRRTPVLLLTDDEIGMLGTIAAGLALMAACVYRRDR
jgi:hypothetical protein